MFKLVIQDDEGKTTVVPLIRDEITIGRKEGNTIRLTERNVSRRHARILRQNGEVQIEDLGSYNGIRVNNARIAERVSLRVSDQVQIGDYKLYLKAEGVEQVDDARTMPIERVDTANTATDVIPAVPHVAAPQVTAPTTPMAIPPTPTPGAVPVTGQLVGNPNRTLVAVADTDPQGRPVATPAQVAAVLSSPMGYGKLVVLSSNFAGKEFELSRPQMIIGRTDENDIVINHRSISRNHAKLVRDPETNRYTISDLQSSNGVRVNGQDYGKVELRRGDVVDLGHVRLRFVEAGEDFVFSRDAVITDVPESGSKKSLFIAIGLAALVVIGVVVVMAMRGGEKKDTNGNNLATQIDGGTAIAEVTVDAAEPQAQLDAASGDPASAIRVRCKENIVKQEWAKAIDCSNELKASDPDGAKQISDTAHAEERADAQLRKLDEAIKTQSISKAKAAYDAIGADSVYRKDADAKYAKYSEDVKNELITAAKKQTGGNCRGWEQLWRQAKNSGTPTDIIDGAKAAVPCTPVVAVKPDKPDVKPDKPDVKPDKPDPCANADELAQKAQDAFAKSQNTDALRDYEAAYRCKGDAKLLKFTFASACRAKSVGKAKLYWKKMSEGMRNEMLGFCVREGITAEVLNQ